MVMQRLLLIADDLDDLKHMGDAESVAECLPRFVILLRLEATEGCATAGGFCPRRVEKRVQFHLRRADMPTIIVISTHNNTNTNMPNMFKVNSKGYLIWTNFAILRHNL